MNGWMFAPLNPRVPTRPGLIPRTPPPWPIIDIPPPWKPPPPPPCPPPPRCAKAAGAPPSNRAAQLIATSILEVFIALLHLEERQVRANASRDEHAVSRYNQRSPILPSVFWW
jgi:hypothetical protein